MQGKEIADSGLQLERIVRLVARKGSIAEVTGYSTGVSNIPYPLLLCRKSYRHCATSMCTVGIAVLALVLLLPTVIVAGANMTVTVRPTGFSA